MPTVPRMRETTDPTRYGRTSSSPATTSQATTEASSPRPEPALQRMRLLALRELRSRVPRRSSASSRCPQTEPRRGSGDGEHHDRPERREPEMDLAVEPVPADVELVQRGGDDPLQQPRHHDGHGAVHRAIRRGMGSTTRRSAPPTEAAVSRTASMNVPTHGSRWNAQDVHQRRRDRAEHAAHGLDADQVDGADRRRRHRRGQEPVHRPRHRRDDRVDDHPLAGDHPGPDGDVPDQARGPQHQHPVERDDAARPPRGSRTSRSCRRGTGTR